MEQGGALLRIALAGELAQQRAQVEHAVIQAPALTHGLRPTTGLNAPCGRLLQLDGRFGIHLHLNGLEGIHVHDVICVVKRWLFVIEWRETHPLEMTSVSLFSPHHDPHRTKSENIQPSNIS